MMPTKRPARKPAAPKQPRPTPAAKPDHTRTVALAGVVGMSGLSALLNGYAAAKAAPTPWLGAIVGAATPAIVLVLSRVASGLHQRRFTRLAAATAASGASLLALSVWHCAASLAALTGSPLALAIPMAIAIDCGFVCCELAADALSPKR